MAVSIASCLDHPLLLVLLADGRLHSGERLAKELNVSRAAVWKGVERLRTLGLDVEALPRRGYRLSSPVELLDAQLIEAEVGSPRRSWLRNLDLRFEVDSTNTRLFALDPPPGGSADVCLTELQHAGRGRRGRPWIAPFGGGIALSMAWTFGDGVRTLPALSLAVGVAIVRAARRAGAQGVTLKWPNDIWFQDRKVGGVLIELRAEASGPACVVIGIGLNVALGAGPLARIAATGIAATDLRAAGLELPRETIVAALLTAFIQGLLEFEQAALKPFLAEWRDADALRGRAVNVTGGEGIAKGIARGIDAHGALLVETAQGVRRFLSGDVTVRAD